MLNKFNALEICTSGSHVQKWVTNLYNYYPTLFSDLFINLRISKDVCVIKHFQNCMLLFVYLIVYYVINS